LLINESGRVDSKLFVRVGPNREHLYVPSGWHLVTAGPADCGDKFVDPLTHCWADIAAADVGYPHYYFDYLIRNHR